MGCMVLWRTFHAAPEQGQGRMGTQRQIQDFPDGGATYYMAKFHRKLDEN